MCRKCLPDAEAALDAKDQPLIGKLSLIGKIAADFDFLSSTRSVPVIIHTCR